MLPKQLFRQIPPTSLVDEILRSCGFLGVHDLRWFSKDEICLDEVETWLPALEPYYLPCKAARFFYGRELGAAEVIPILKHCLLATGHTLATSERLYRGAKQTLYQIQPVKALKDLSGVSMEVSFD